MKKDIKFGKNPKPNSIHLPTLRAYIILQSFSYCLPLRPLVLISPSFSLSLRTPETPEMLLFSL